MSSFFTGADASVGASVPPRRSAPLAGLEAGGPVAVAASRQLDFVKPVVGESTRRV
jgi:hypothetical protein